MNKPLFTPVVISILGMGFSSAQSVELMPELEDYLTAGEYYEAGGRLCNDSITGADVSGWLGENEDGWYATIGGLPTEPDTIRDVVMVESPEVMLRCTSADAGICAGVVMTVDFSKYSSLTLNGSSYMWIQGSIPCVWSLWYESSSAGEAVLLYKDTIVYEDDSWLDFSCTVEGDQYRQMAADGTGKLYFVIGFDGSRGKNPLQSARFKDLSLTGNIPEPATATLGLLGLAALASRRRRIA